MPLDYMQAKGWIKDNEAILLHDLAKDLPADAVILNIGVEYGKSLACLRTGNPTATIYGLDLDCSKAVSDYGCTLIEADSHELVKTWNEPLDLIFVDGDHGEIGVLMDAGFGDWLKPNCYLLFQDTWDYDNPTIIHQVCPGVMAGVNRWFAQAHIQAEFEEWPSVDTTRVFKRVKEHEHEQSAAMADSGSDNSNLRTAGYIEQNNKTSNGEFKIRRQNKTSGRG